MMFASISIYIVGILCLLYYGIIVMYAGFSTSFGVFWLTSGLVALVFGGSIRYIIKHHIIISNSIKIIALVLISVSIIIFAIIEGAIIYQGNKKPSKDIPYMIVLGAQVRGTTITKSLRYRLDIAATYLKDNPNTKVIVSGGKGKGEDITESMAMKFYLLGEGISIDRIIEENQSTNTYENLKFSKELMEQDIDKVVIVTNKFHIFRATSIAKKTGFTEVEGLGAKSDKVLSVSYYVREVFAVIKDKLIGNM